MDKPRFKPELIFQPIQLCAACLIATTSWCGIFLFAASRMVSGGNRAAWLSCGLVIGSILLAILMQIFLFVLIMFYRRELLGGREFIEIERQREELKSKAKLLKDLNPNFERLVNGLPASEPAYVSENSKRVLNELTHQLQSAEKEIIDLDTIREIAQTCLWQGRWADAAKYFDTYVSKRPKDWLAQIYRGVAYDYFSVDSNAAAESALEAYDKALTGAPESICNNWKARLYTYRGAIKKRLHRIKDAKADFEKALQCGAKDDRVVRDVYYNLLCVNAIGGDDRGVATWFSKLMDNARDPKRELALIEKHQNDYFKNYPLDKLRRGQESSATKKLKILKDRVKIIDDHLKVRKKSTQ